MTNYLLNYRRTRIPGYVGGIKPKGLFTPKDITGLGLWLAADKETTLADNDPVSSWTDFSGNNFHAVQTNATYKPLFKTNIINGLPAIQFDNSDDFMTVNAGLSIGNDTNFGILIVYNTLGSYAASKRVINGTSNNWLMGPHQNLHRMYNGAFIEDGASDDTDFRYMLVVGTAGFGQSLRVNAADIGFNSNTTAPGGIMICAQTETLYGNIPEIIAYLNTSLTGNNIIDLEKYVSTKYGLAYSPTYSPINSIATVLPCAGGWGSPKTLSHSVGPGDNRLLLVGICGQPSINGTSVTYDGISLTRLDRTAGTDSSAELWYLLDPPVGTHDIVWTKNVDDNASIGAISFKGISQSDPFSNLVSSTELQSGTTHHVDVSSTATGIVFGLISMYGSVQISTDTSGGVAQLWWMSHANNPAEYQNLGAYIAGTGSTVTITWNKNESGGWTGSTIGVVLNKA
jgi:hypothetical protein